MRSSVRAFLIAALAAAACSSAQEKAAALVARAAGAAKQGKSQEAQSLYDEALRLDRGSEAAHIGKAALLQATDPQRAIAILSECPSENCVKARQLMLRTAIDGLVEARPSNAEALIAAVANFGARDLVADACPVWKVLDLQPQLDPTKRAALASAVRAVIAKLGVAPEEGDVASGNRLAYSAGTGAGNSDDCQSAVGHMSAVEGQYRAIRGGSPGDLDVTMGTERRRRMFLLGLLEARLARQAKPTAQPAPAKLAGARKP
jgi:hypothetical protein